jgi:hypothetical protein
MRGIFAGAIVVAVWPNETSELPKLAKSRRVADFETLKQLFLFTVLTHPD